MLAVASIGPAPEVLDLMNESLRDKDVTIRQSQATRSRLVDVRPQHHGAVVRIDRHHPAMMDAGNG